MEELLQAPTDGVGDAIVVPLILPNQFELKIAGGNFLTKNTQEALTIIKNKSKVQTSQNKPYVSSASESSTQDAAITALTKQVEDIISSMNRPINSIQNGCETCGGPHAYYECQVVVATLKRAYMLLRTPIIRVVTLSNPKTLQERPQVHPPPPLSSSNEVERDPKSTTDQVLTERTTRVPSPVVHPSPASELPPAPASSFVIPERNPHQLRIPYPLRLNNGKLQDKSDIQIHSFLQMFTKLYFNISFAKALVHMPKYAKMVKDLLTNKEKLFELVNTPLNENCSAVLLKKLPEKLGDTGRFLFHVISMGLSHAL
nr:reverse transcriptase domain-containing protein [Tanacetum cinerariifolium]